MPWLPGGLETVTYLPVLSAPFPGAGRWGGAASEKVAEKTLRERQGEPAPGRERRKGR